MLAAISVEYLGANAKTLLHKDEHLYHQLMDGVLSSCYDGSSAQENMAVFVRVARVYQASLTIILSFSSMRFASFHGRQQSFSRVLLKC